MTAARRVAVGMLIGGSGGCLLGIAVNYAVNTVFPWWLG